MRIEFERISNVRDLGGLPATGGARVRPGLLFRGDQPHFASEADLAKLAGLGLGAMIDLRSPGEVAEKPDPVLPGVRGVHINVFDEVGEGIVRGSEGDKRIVARLSRGEHLTEADIDAHMRDMYRDLVRQPTCRAGYARLVDEVLACVQAGRGALWHCTAGKDRAGFGAVVLLSALGVPREAILEDYLLTNACLEGEVEHLMAWLSEKLPDAASSEAALRYFMADERFLSAAFEAADEGFGSFDGFLEAALGVTPAKRGALREALLVR